MQKGRWIRRIAWGLVILLTLFLIALSTARLWLPSAARLVLATRGVHVKFLAWEGKDSIKATDIRIDRPAAEIQISSLTTLKPKAWRQALRKKDPDATYVTINGWKIIPKQNPTTNSPPIAAQLQSLQTQLDKLQQNCPHAILLNGFIQTQAGEFRSGAIEWKDGQLAGDFTWPGLNDPADFKLTKTNLIIRQLALEIGSKLTLQQTNQNMRIAGYARWKTNRIDLDLTFTPTNNLPLQGQINSKGLTLPGNLIGLPQIEQLSPQFTLTYTNSRISLRLSEPATGTSSDQSSSIN